MWTIFFLGSLTYCTYTIVQNFVEYFQYQTSISITVNQELPADFPAITICNINPFNEKISSSYINLKFKLFECNEDSGTLTDLTQCFNNSIPYAVVDTVVDKLKRIIANDDLTEQDRNALGYDLDLDMFVSCEFNSIPCYPNLNFTSFWSSMYGNCYTFNDGLKNQILKTSEVGPNYGLRMELVVSKLT